MKFLFPALLLALAACSRELGLEERGKAAFASYNCRQCHRVGKAGGTTGPDLTYAGFRKSREFLDLWLENPSAWEPRTMMPNFHLSQPTRSALSAYLAGLRGQDESSPPSWEKAGSDPAKRGEALYTRLGCQTCHGVRGSGGYPNNNVPGGKIPGLTHAAEGFTRQELLKKIAEGVKPVKENPQGPEPRLSMPAWKEVLKPKDLEDLADYLISLKPPPSQGEEW